MLHHQALMLDGLEHHNVRGLITIADRIATRIAEKDDPKVAVAEAFARFGCIEEVPVKQAPSRAAGAKAAPVAPLAAEPDEVDATDQSPFVPAIMSPSVHHYGEMGDTLLNLYNQHLGNVAAMERDLYRMGIPFSRRKIAALLDAMGLKRLRKPREK